MKIINNTDINNLILYAKKNLGIYKLVYKEKKKNILFINNFVADFCTYISNKYNAGLF